MGGISMHLECVLLPSPQREPGIRMPTGWEPADTPSTCVPMSTTSQHAWDTVVRLGNCWPSHHVMGGVSHVTPTL